MTCAHCPACAGSGVYAGEPCALCGPQYIHDPRRDAGLPRWAWLLIVAFAVWLII